MLECAMMGKIFLVFCVAFHVTAERQEVGSGNPDNSDESLKGTPDKSDESVNALVQGKMKIKNGMKEEFAASHLQAKNEDLALSEGLGEGEWLLGPKPAAKPNTTCTETNKYKVTTSKHPMKGGDMYCAYPSGEAGDGYPLLSLEHGDQEGGLMLPSLYDSFLEYVASSGFVVCAPTMCFTHCRDQQTTHQLDAITAAQDLGAKGVLPIRSNGTVGVLGHSTGGMTTLKCSARDAVATHNIAAALVYNGDGGSMLLPSDGVKFEDIEPTLPMFLVTGTEDTVEPKNSTDSNKDLILAANPTQPLLVSMITGETHLDPIHIPIVHSAPLMAAPYIVAFFGSTLAPLEECRVQYKNILGAQLTAASSDYSDNGLLDASATLG